MPRAVNIPIGTKFGELTVIAFAGLSSRQHRQWVCTCSCGNEVTVLGYNLRLRQRFCGKCRNGNRGRLKVGDQVGRLILLERRPKEHAWVVLCGCGITKTCSTSELTMRQVVSCGCAKHEGNNRRHGHSTRKSGQSPTYRSWQAMLTRCLNENREDFLRYYGGRGITVCERWLDSFENFLTDMGERPSGTSLDRVDPYGNYEPTNCRWATAKEQANNKRARQV